MGDVRPGVVSDPALDELHAGQPGPELLQLLGRVIRAVAAKNNFPHPEEGLSWSDGDALDSALSSFFAEHDGQRRLDSLALQATNDQHLRRLLHTAVYNWFADLARATPRGRLHRATRRRLEQEPEVFQEVEPGEFWTLCDAPQEPGVVGDAVLDRALGRVNITLIRARPDGVNERPWASRDDQISALRAMLNEAACAVHLQPLVRAIAARIGLHPRPTHIEIDEAGTQLEGVADDVDDGSEERAREIYNQLSHRERLLIAHTDNTDQKVRDIANATGIPRSSVKAVRERVAEALQRSGAVDDPAVVARLRAMCEQADVAWTADSCLPSPHREEGRP